MRTYKIMAIFLLFGLSMQGYEDLFKDKNLKSIVGQAPVMTDALRNRIFGSLFYGSIPIVGMPLWKMTYDLSKPFSWKTFPWTVASAAISVLLPMTYYKVGSNAFESAKYYDARIERNKELDDFSELDNLITELRDLNTKIKSK